MRVVWAPGCWFFNYNTWVNKLHFCLSQLELGFWPHTVEKNASECRMLNEARMERLRIHKKYNPPQDVQNLDKKIHNYQCVENKGKYYNYIWILFLFYNFISVSQRSFNYSFKRQAFFFLLSFRHTCVSYKNKLCANHINTDYINTFFRGKLQL